MAAPAIGPEHPRCRDRWAPVLAWVVLALMLAVAWAGTGLRLTTVPSPVGGPLGLSSVPPPTPVSFSVSPGNRTVEGSWAPTPPSSGAGVTYTLNWSSTLGGPTVGSLTTANTTATATDLVNGYTYFFSVAARDAYGNSTGTGVLASTPLSLPYPPTLIVVAALSATTLNIEWSPPCDDGGTPVSSYTLFYANAPSGPWTAYVVGTDLEVDLVGLASATPYYIQVVASNAAGTSHPSRTLTAVTFESPGIPNRTAPPPNPTSVGTPLLVFGIVPGSVLLAVLGTTLAVLMVLPLVLLILRWRRPPRRRRYRGP